MELNAATRRRVTRDVTGPTPHSVGIRARQITKHPPEYFILERRKRDEEKERGNAIANECHKIDFKNIWESVTDKKIMKNTIQRKMDSLLQFQQNNLDERRERLRHLLQSEEEEYMAEATSKQETILERQAKMRERARMLRERREKERLALVEEKLDQRWRTQCEELRCKQSKYQEEEVRRGRDELLRIKEEERKRDEQKEAMYTKLWENDRLAKSKREEMETALRIEQNKETLELLNMQMAAREKEKEDLKNLREKEAELLREEAALRAIEETRLLQEKKRKQEKTRSVLDFSLKLKMKKRARLVQEELALDMKILEKILAENTNEAKENLQRKDQLREEIHQYKMYLEEQDKLEKKREKELEMIVNAELERQWSRRLEQWKGEREARKKLMKEVFDTRKKQIGEKLAQIAQEKVEMGKESAKLLKNFEDHKRLEKQQLEEKRQGTLSYKRDLLDQMNHLELVRELEKQQIQEEAAMCNEAEAIYQRRVQDALSNPNLIKKYQKKTF